MSVIKNRTVIGILCIVLSLVICFAAVSYTHLDVYKRQGHGPEDGAD